MGPIFTVIGSMLVGALALLGIGGLVFHMFRDDGWISKGMSAIWEAQYQAPMTTITLIVAALFIIRMMHSAQIGGKRSSALPDLILYIFIATGIYFLYRLAATGEL